MNEGTLLLAYDENIKVNEQQMLMKSLFTMIGASVFYVGLYFASNAIFIEI